MSVNCAGSYEGAVKELVWSLKFGRAKAAAEIMGRCLAEAYGPFTRSDTLVVPAPTAMRRVRTRGYDQARLIACSFAHHTGLDYASLLCRKGSQEQKGADKQRRHTQLQGVFDVCKPRAAYGRRILLIDDVVTTGATLEEAAKILRAHGAQTVGALAFARA